MDLSSYKVNEYIKTEKYYVHDLRNGNGTFLYDEFIDGFWEVPNLHRAEYEEDSFER